MLDHILRFALRQRALMILAAVVLLAAGVLAWQKLPIDAFPDVTNVQVMILAEAPGLAPSEVERLITVPIEIEMGGLPKVKQVRSSSKAGLSQVIIVFDDDADTYFTRQVVFERLTAAAKEKVARGRRAGDGADLHRPGRDLPVLAGIRLLLPQPHRRVLAHGREMPAVRPCDAQERLRPHRPADTAELAGHAPASTPGRRQRGEQLRRVRQAVPRRA